MVVGGCKQFVGWFMGLWDNGGSRRCGGDGIVKNGLDFFVVFVKSLEWYLFGTTWTS